MSENKKTESHDGFKTVASLFASPTVAMTVLLNTAFIHLALEILSSSEKVKARDPRTLLNVYKNSPSDVPTQIVGYLNSFYENLWENWSKSAENAFGNNFTTIDNEIRSHFNVPPERNIYQEIIDTWDECKKIPYPNPSPVNAQPIADSPQVQPSVGAV